MYFRFREDGSAECCLEKNAWPDLVYVDTPEGFDPDKLHEWRYQNGEWTHTPSVEPPPQPTQAERIAALEEELRAAKILLGLEV